jgi:cysteinyl-tRNA synthetase
MQAFIDAMDEDLNVPEGMKNVFEFIRKVNKLADEGEVGVNAATQALDFLKKIDSVMGVFDFSEKFFELNTEQETLIKEREVARKNKDWKKSDELRQKIKELGLELVDNKDGSTTAKPIQK